MKKMLCVSLALLLLLCGCSSDSVFIKSENDTIVSNSGVEYTLLANEGVIYYLGKLKFVGNVQGEEKISQHLDALYKTGMYAIDNAENDNILIRRVPNNEWFSVYRKSSLPNFDVSVDNCIRLEFVSGSGNCNEDAIHTTCGAGITDQYEISTFLSEIRGQKNPREAGLYDLIKKPDGMLENCYVYGVVYGFFEEDPNVVVRMNVTSYNDLAYSISIGEKNYVLSEEWLRKLENQVL